MKNDSKTEFKLIDNTKRRSLNEGRNYGFGSGFAKRDGDTLTMIMPITACGDFLHEPVHSEKSGKNWSIYGLSSSKQNIYDLKRQCAYLVCGILEYNSGGKYGEFDRDYKALADNYKSLEKFINWFEKSFGLKKFTKITKISENRYVFETPLFWTEGTYLISLHKFLSRMGIHYTGGDAMDYLNKFNQCFTDASYYKQFKPKLEKMLAGFIPAQEMKTTDYCPHNLGIVNYSFPSDGKQIAPAAKIVVAPIAAPAVKPKGVIKAADFLKQATFKLT